MKFAHSVYSGMILIKIREGRYFFYGAMDGHVTLVFLTNESRVRASRAEKSRGLLQRLS
jgi:hypothetical protein